MLTRGFFDSDMPRCGADRIDVHLPIFMGYGQGLPSR